MYVAQITWETLGVVTGVAATVFAAIFYIFKAAAASELAGFKNDLLDQLDARYVANTWAAERMKLNEMQFAQQRAQADQLIQALRDQDRRDDDFERRLARIEFRTDNHG